MVNLWNVPIAPDVIIRIRSIADNSGFQSAQHNLSLLQGSIARVGQASGLLAVRFRQSLLAFTAAIVGVGAAFSGVETAQINLQRVTGLQGKQFTDLADRVKGLARSLGLTSTQALDLATQASKLGIEGSDLTTFIRTAAQAAQALGQDAGVTAQQLAKLRASLGLTVPDVNKLTGAVVALDNVSAAAFPEILTSMQRAAGLGKLLGVSGQDIAAMTTALLETGVTAERAGTGLQRLFAALINRRQDISSVVGFDVGALAPTDAVLQISKTFAQLVAQGGDTQGFLKAFGGEGMRVIEVLSKLGGNVGRVNDLMAAANKEFEQGTLLAKLFGQAADSLGFKLKQLWESVLSAAQAIGQKLAPTIHAISDGIMAFADMVKNSPLLQYVAAFTLLGGVVVSLTGFLGFFTLANVIAFQVIKKGLFEASAGWRGLVGAILGATAAQATYNAVASVNAPGYGFQKRLGASYANLAGPASHAAGFALLDSAASPRVSIFARIAPLAASLGASLRAMAGLAGRIFLPVSAALGVIVAIKDNIFGAGDALKRMIKPFGELFGSGSEGKSGLGNIMKLLRQFVQIIAYIVAGPLRLLAEIIRIGVVEPLVFVVRTINAILGPVTDLLGDILNTNTFGSQTGGGLPSLRPTAASFNVVPGAAGRNSSTTVNFVNPVVRNASDLETMEDIARRVIRDSRTGG